MFLPADDRASYLMELLHDLHGYPLNAAAGIVGNLWGESGLLPNRVETSQEATPMRARDWAGRARDFTPDEIMNRSGRTRVGPGAAAPGIGLAQWTSAERRRGLFAGGDSSILFDMDRQIEYLVGELTGRFGA
jgi:hypothetical protein